jgi:hypothetical protein
MNWQRGRSYRPAGQDVRGDRPRHAPGAVATAFAVCRAFYKASARRRENARRVPRRAGEPEPLSIQDPAMLSSRRGVMIFHL